MDRSFHLKDVPIFLVFLVFHKLPYDRGNEYIIMNEKKKKPAPPDLEVRHYERKTFVALGRRDALPLPQQRQNHHCKNDVAELTADDVHDDHRGKNRIREERPQMSLPHGVPRDLMDALQPFVRR